MASVSDGIVVVAIVAAGILTMFTADERNNVITISLSFISW